MQAQLGKEKNAHVSLSYPWHILVVGAQEIFAKIF